VIHARSDYNHIQDPTGKIPADEPVFILRGTDVCAPDAISHWAHLAEQRGAKADIINAALDQATAMRKYQREHGVGKIPDMPESAIREVK
jgi:hypothetical protein